MTPAEPSHRFRSFAELKDAHTELLRRQRELGDAARAPGAFLDDVGAYIRACSASGVMIDADKDREAAQTYLDYWATRLVRAGRPSDGAVLDEFSAELAPELPDLPCPYVGLSAFQEGDQRFFHGRQRLVDEMLSVLGRRRLIAVVGSSGSGKSSLVLAGLLPRLRAGGLPGSAAWQYALMVPGSAPVAGLERALAAPPEATRLLVVDQFEETFTLCQDGAQRAAFAARLMELASAPDRDDRVILTMREDFVDSMVRLPDLHLAFATGRIDVGALDINELRDVIETPAAQVGLKFDEGIVDDLISTILGERAGLPLLQFTLLRLWVQRRRNRITREVYASVGNPRQALERSAEAFYSELIPEDRDEMRRILLSMVRPGAGIEVTSSRILRSALYKAGVARDRTDRVLERLVEESRLLKLTHGDDPADAQVEVAHEALVRNWPRLVDWLGEERERLRQRFLLRDIARQWAAQDSAPDAAILLRGRALEDAEQYDDLDEDERAFVAASRALADAAEREKEAQRQRELDQARALAEAERRRATLLRRMLGVSGVLTAAALVFGVAALAAQNSATAAEGRAVSAAATARANESLARNAQATSEAGAKQIQDLQQQTRGRELSFLAVSEIDTDPERAVLVALEALSIGPSVEGEDALRQTLLRSQVRSRLAGHADRLFDARFSPDGLTVATAANDGTVRVWNAGTGQLQRVITHTGAVWNAAYSPDGGMLATAGADNAIHLWDVGSGAEVRRLTGHTGVIFGLEFDADGRRLVSASGDKTARVWDVASGREVTQLIGHEQNVLSADFSPDGTKVATAGGDALVRIWDTASGRQLRMLVGHTNAVWSVAFSPDGSRLATASGDRSARIWDVETGDPLVDIRGHERDVFDATYSPDGRVLVSASLDKTIRMWDAFSGKALQTFKGHEDGVFRVAFTADGARIVSSSFDRTARVWNAQSGNERRIIGTPGRVFAAAFAPDSRRVALDGALLGNSAGVWDAQTGGRLASFPQAGATGVQFSPSGDRLVTAGPDRVASVIDAATGRVVRDLSGHSATVWTAAFSPDGKRIVTASGDRTAKIWDAESGSEVLTLRGHQSDVFGASFSPDGKRVATSANDKTARVWNAETGELLFTLEGHTDGVFAVRFSPDGRLIATGGIDRTVRLWDADAGKPLRVLIGHEDRILGLSFSPDGRRVVSGSFDRTARIWSVDRDQPVATLRGAERGVWSAEYSPDGKSIITASEDGGARIYAAALDEVLTLARSRVTRELSCAERVQVLRESRNCPGQ